MVAVADGKLFSFGTANVFSEIEITPANIRDVKIFFIFKGF
jgi:hypothetical protein